MLKEIFRNRQYRVPRLVLRVFLPIALGAPLLAQTAGMGGLRGSLVDASGNPLANATVTATSTDSGQTRSITTGVDGAYKFGGLPPGKYKLKFEAAGLRTLEIPSTTISGSETTVLDEKLEA